MSDDLNVNGPAKGDTGGDGSGDGDNGNQGEGFISTLPEEIRRFEGLKNIKDPVTLATKFVELSKAQPVVPEKPDAYQIAVPEGMEKDDNFLNGFKSVAHEARLTQAQVATVNNWWNSKMAEATAERAKIENQMHETSIKTIRDMWGADYDKNIEIARKARRTFGGDALAEFLEVSKLGDHPIMIDMFYKIGKSISEDTFRGGDPPKGGPKRTPGGEPILDFPSMKK